MKIEDMKSKDYAELGRELIRGFNSQFEKDKVDNSRQKFKHIKHIKRRNR